MELNTIGNGRVASRYGLSRNEKFQGSDKTENSTIGCKGEEHEESKGSLCRFERIDVGCAQRPSLVIEVLSKENGKFRFFYAMRSGPIPLGQLARSIPDASKKMLTQNLRKLEVDGIVIRKDLSDLVPQIEYDLADSAREATCDLRDHIVRWSKLYLESITTKDE